MNRWRVLVVDDIEVVALQTAEFLRSRPVSSTDDFADVEHTTSFQQALELLAERHYDLLVLDVRNESDVDAMAEADDATGSDATVADVGLAVFDDVRARRFVPIIFYTAVPGLVTGLAEPPFVSVVSKSAELDELLESVRAVFDSTLPAIHQALLGHVEQITREFMTEFVEQHWPDLSSPARKGDLTHLLLRRLALSLANGGEVLAGRLQGEPGLELHPDAVHPMRFYVIPPVDSWTTGDVVRKTLPAPEADVSSIPAPIGDASAQLTASDPSEAWYVILTPACDLVPSRVSAEFVVLAECVQLVDTEEFAAWRASRPVEGAEPSAETKRADTRMNLLMRNNRDKRGKDRDIYLPGAWNVPDLVVDFQRIVHVRYEELAEFERVATLDSPYAEALIDKFGRYLGRVGTPDLDLTVPLSRLAEL